MRILLSNVGRRTYLVESILQLSEDIDVFVTDTDQAVAGLWVSESLNRFITPRVSDSEQNYLHKLYEICAKQKIDLLIPLMDYEFPVISKNIEMFERIGCKVLISNHHLVNQTLNKELNFYFSKSLDIQVPNSYFDLNDVPSDRKIIKKRILGSGSVGIEIFENKSYVKSFIPGEEMIQEFINGQEYGIDIFNDFEGKYVHSCVKKKIAMRSGETDKAEVVYNPMFDKVAEDMSQRIKHVGNLDADFILDEQGRIYWIDFNLRFGGGYPFTMLAGFNYLSIIIKILTGQPYNIPKKGKKIVGMKGIQMFYYEK